MAEVRPHKNVRERGFTLIETMIAMALVGFGLLVITQLQAIGSRGLKRTVENSLAMNLAMNELEVLMVTPYADLGEVPTTTYYNLFGDDTGGNQAAGKYTVQWSAIKNDFFADVSVEVFWNTRSPAPATSAEADHYIRRFTTQILDPDRATRR